jgi:F-type H+-transporting ATPase subunit b
MLRRFAITGLLTVAPAAAFAEGGMPQMDFQNPLTADQIIWMAVILVALYLALSRWGLPRMGGVLENRAMVIQRDLDAARAAKAAADNAVKAMETMMRHAREKAQSEVAAAMVEAKAKAAGQAAELSRRMDMRLAESEAQIAVAREAALAAIKPVAEETAVAILTRLTGFPPNRMLLSRQVDIALTARAAA